MPSATRPSGISGADRAKLAAYAAENFATAAQGVKADSALQSVPDATTSVKGLTNKAAALTAAAAGTVTNNVGGTVLSTVPVLVGALYATDGPAIASALTTAMTKINLLNARVEDLIAKQQTAGQQT